MLNLCFAHSIVTESRLNLPNGFHLAVAQFLAKFDVAVLQSFHNFPYNENPTSTKHYLTQMLLSIN